MLSIIYHSTHPARKLELNHSDSPTLFNQEVEEVQIPRSVSISESLSCNTDCVNEHPHGDEWDFLQRHSKDWKIVSLLESFR